MLKLMRRTDILAGLLMILLAALGLWQALRLRPGTLTNMGAGYVPIVLSIGLMFLGAGIVTIAVRQGESGEKVGRWPLRPVTLIAAAILAFALLIDSMGLMVAVGVTSAIAIAASTESRLIEAMALIIGLMIFCSGLFVLLLGLPIPLLPQS
jgi:hypothetical protein